MFRRSEARPRAWIRPFAPSRLTRVRFLAAPRTIQDRVSMNLRFPKQTSLSSPPPIQHGGGAGPQFVDSGILLIPAHQLGAMLNCCMDHQVEGTGRSASDVAVELIVTGSPHLQPRSLGCAEIESPTVRGWQSHRKVNLDTSVVKISLHGPHLARLRVRGAAQLAYAKHIDIVRRQCCQPVPACFTTIASPRNSQPPAPDSISRFDRSQWSPLL